MKHPEHVADYLEHIALAIERPSHIWNNSKALTRFRETSKHKTVIRDIEIIGEAASRVQREQPEFVTAHRNYRGSRCAGCAIR